LLRRLSLFVLFSLLTLPLFAQTTCNLEMSVHCTPGANGAASQCTSTTTNVGTNACSGLFYAGFFAEASPKDVQFTGTTNSLGLGDCFSSDLLGDLVTTAFDLCGGDASLHPGASFTASTGIRGALAQVPVIGVTFVLDPLTEETAGSAYAFANIELPTCTPRISAPAITQTGSEYTVSWTAVSDPSATFTIEESTSADFSSGVTARQTSALATTFRHDVTATTTYYYRVKASNCVGGQPQYSQTASTVVQVPQAQARNPEGVAPFGSTTPIQIPVFIPGPSGKGAIRANDSTFTASTDKPYLTVTPASGVLPPTGTTVMVTASPTALPPGANTGTLSVSSNGATVATTPVTISLVTPVSPVTKTSSPNSLIIPVVTHVNGAAGPFLSDVRLTNAGANAAKYQVTFTPTHTNAATTPSKATPVTVAGGGTVALNDIAKNFFGYGATTNPNDFGFGSLEILPLESAGATYASSRTYASTSVGTFGQFIAAVPVTKFATRATDSIPLPGSGPAAPTKLSLQQVAQSAKFRTNFGIVEGSGQAAKGVVRIIDAAGNLLKSVDFNLAPGEHQQTNNFIAASGVPTLEDGRLEVEITSPTGAVTAYASVLDNLTTDPLAVMPVDVSQVKARRYVLPGMAAVNNFFSDVRIYNGGTSEALVNATFYPQGNLPFVAAQAMRIPAGTIKVIDNVLPTLFNVPNGGGSIVLTTASDTSLVATGRTYSIAANGGTYGQFIPGVTPAEAVAINERPLQILQLEQSALFRTNIGLAETSGNSAKVEVSLVLPDSKATPVLEFALAPNEFRQFSLRDYGLPAAVYNVRAVVRVTEGSGRVTAYGSVIDNATADPTYVPAQ
jgi:hypothetical protein